MDYLQYTDITDNIVIIKINQTYYDGMTDLELYEFTRGYWKRKIESISCANYALAVAFGEVKEVYRIDRWVHASEADNVIRKYDPNRHSDRIAFYGEVADKSTRNRYIGKCVSKLYQYGEANPVKLFLKNSY